MCPDTPDNDATHRQFVVRNRILLYLHGMEMGALPGMEMASEILREVGPDAGMEEIFDVMHDKLRDHGVDFPLASSPESGLRCFPPLNRRPMLAAPVERLSLLELAGKFFVGFFGLVTLRYILWDRR